MDPHRESYSRSLGTQSVQLLRKDAFFLIGFSVALFLVFSVEQVHDVLFQTVHLPGKMFGAAITDRSTWFAAEFVLFLIFATGGSLASVAFVIPPSFLSFEKTGAKPIMLPKPPRWFVVSSLVIVCFCATPIAVDILPPWFLIFFGSLVVAWGNCVAVGKLSGLLVHWAEVHSPLARRRWGQFAVLIGSAIFSVAAFSRRLPFAYTGHKSFLSLLGAFAFIAGVWLLTTPREVNHDDHRMGSIRTACGRFMCWLFLTMLLGEALWILASWSWTSYHFSYRLYTIWAILELCLIIVITGSFIDTCDQHAPVPCRLLALFAIVILAISLKIPLAEEWNENQAEVVATPTNFVGALSDRIEKTDPRAPVLIVAASGGGSRAAVFAGLVYEALQRRPIPNVPDKVWADQIIMVSGVSGGGLASAHYVHGLDSHRWIGNPARTVTGELRSTVRGELIDRTTRRAGELLDKAQAKLIKISMDDADRLRAGQYVDSASAVEKWLTGKELTETEKSRVPLWLFDSVLTDDLCTDFMAPILRGALTPGKSRGQSLREFWKNRFDWGESDDQRGYTCADKPQGFDPAIQPVLLLGTCNVRSGSRIACGFPRIPDKLFDQLPNDKFLQINGSPGSLPEMAKIGRLELNQAVALSANFPFGFNPVSVQARATNTNLLLLDGGIVDNTGIDTIYYLINAMKAVADNGPPREEVFSSELYQDCTRVMNALASRKVIFVEIDSGAKPSKTGLLAKLFSVVLDPLDALNHAAFENATMDRNTYLRGLKYALGSRRAIADLRSTIDANAEILSVADRRELEVAIALAESEGNSCFSVVRLECNDIDDENVPTSWALSPYDKARILARFAIEWPIAFAELEQNKGDCNRLTDLVQSRINVRTAERLQKSLAAARNISAELSESQNNGEAPNMAKVTSLQKNLEDANVQYSKLPVKDARLESAIAGLKVRYDDRAKKWILPTAAGARPPADSTAEAQIVKDVRRTQQRAQKDWKKVAEKKELPWEQRTRVSKLLFEKPEGTPDQRPRS